MKRLAIPAVVVWVILVGVGVEAIVRYATTPGAVAATPATWPERSRLVRSPIGATVVVFAHPKCPCTRATLVELASIARTAAPTTRIAVAFEVYDPADRAAHADIPGVTTVFDDGSEAARFGALTSGHVVVYDVAGHLQFAGGITGSRGHIGENIGSQAVAALARGDGSSLHDHAVFGCALEGGS